MRRVGWILLVLSGAAKADFMDGNDFLAACVNNREYVQGYIAGFHDKALQDKASVSFYVPLSEMEKNNSFRVLTNVVKDYCAPERATLRQLTDVVCKHLKDNPQRRHIEATILAHEAFREAFPCSR